MFGVLLDGYGDYEVLKYREDLEKPKIESDEDVLVEVHYSVNHLDTKLRKGYMSKMNIKILGIEYSGVVADKGKGIKNFSVGDRIFGFSLPKMSTYSQFIVVPASQVRKIPESIPMNEASSYPCSILTVFQSFKKMLGEKICDSKIYSNGESQKLLANKNLVIVGISGPIGLMAFCLAKFAFGCTSITGICSKKNHEGVRKVGCENLVDYREENYVDKIFQKKIDIVLDCYGGYDNLEMYSSVMKGNGMYVTFGVPDGVNPGEFAGKIQSKKNCFFVGHKNIPDELSLVSGVLEKFKCLGKVPFTEYDLKDVKKCHKDYETGRPMGKLILKVKN